MKTGEIAKELVGFKTLSPVQETSVFEYMKRLLAEHGIASEIHEVDGVYSLTASTGDGKPHICLSGHLDVVEPEGQWSVTDPFNPVIEDGRLYGRGATDMKGAVAAQIKTLIDLHGDEDFDGRATLMATGDEEIGGNRGTEALINDLEEEFDYALVGEPTDLNVQVGVRGVLWLNVRLRGEGIHASRAQLAELNVMEELPEALERLNSFESGHSYSGDLPTPSFEVTKIDSTDAYNSVPGEVEIGIDTRYVPTQKPEEIRKEVEEALRGIGCEYTVEIEKHPGKPYELESQKLRKAVRTGIEEATGEPPEEITEGGSSDGRFFARRDTPFVEVGTNQAAVHAENEYCDIERLRELRKSFYLTSKNLAGE